jgi:hypothetical protein
LGQVFATITGWRAIEVWLSAPIPNDLNSYCDLVAACDVVNEQDDEPLHNNYGSHIELVAAMRGAASTAEAFRCFFLSSEEDCLDSL